MRNLADDNLYGELRVNDMTGKQIIQQTYNELFYFMPLWPFLIDIDFIKQFNCNSNFRMQMINLC